MKVTGHGHFSKGCTSAIPTSALAHLAVSRAAPVQVKAKRRPRGWSARGEGVGWYGYVKRDMASIPRVPSICVATRLNERTQLRPPLRRLYGMPDIRTKGVAHAEARKAMSDREGVRGERAIRRALARRGRANMGSSRWGRRGGGPRGTIAVRWTLA